MGAQLGTAAYQGATHFFPADDPPGSEASGALHLLPGFDEFLLWYQDRSATLDGFRLTAAGSLTISAADG